jgi:hypothetical protein
MIEIPLDDRDAQLLPQLHEYFKSFRSDTSQEPRAKKNRFVARTPIVDRVTVPIHCLSTPPFPDAFLF